MDNKEKYKRQYAYRERNKKSIYEKQLVYIKSLYKNNPKRFLEYAKRYYKKNRELILKKEAKRRKDPKTIARRRVHAAVRRTRTAKVEEGLVGLVQVMLKESAYCTLCGIKMRSGGRYPDGKTLDHILPLCIGGDNSIKNIRIICFKCNISRPKRHFSLAPELQ